MSIDDETDENEELEEGAEGAEEGAASKDNPESGKEEAKSE